MKANIKRFLSVFLAVVTLFIAVCVTTGAASDETTVDEYIVIGSYEQTPLRWKVLEKHANGNLTLISEFAIAKTKFNGTDFAQSDIFTELNEKFYNSAFSEQEKEAIIKTNTIYASDTNPSAEISAYVVLPSKVDVDNYGLTKAQLLNTTNNTSYWLADWNKTNTLGRGVINTLNANGRITPVISTQSSIAYRPMITIAGAYVVELIETKGITYQSADGQVITHAILNSSFKVIADSSYDSTNMKVKAGNHVIEQDNGLYKATGNLVTVDGVVVKPADYSEYDKAVAKAFALDKELYLKEKWEELEQALNRDVSGLAMTEQGKVDEATAAILTAIESLVEKPADFTKFDAAVERAEYILERRDLYNINAFDETEQLSYANLINAILAKKDKIKTYTVSQQNLVDEATEKLNSICDAVPYKYASIAEWNKYIEIANSIGYSTHEAEYVDLVRATIAEVVAEHDYGKDRVTIDKQAKVDAATQKIKDVVAIREGKLLVTDYRVLEEALRKAETYREEDFFKDEETDREEYKGGSEAWERFVSTKEAAEIQLETKQNAPIKIQKQAAVDDAAAALISAMGTLNEYKKPDKHTQNINEMKFFFSDIMYSIQGIIDFLSFLTMTIGMVFRGEIDISALKELIKF